MNFLLDTNVCIALINGTSNAARAAFINAVRSRDSLSISTIVVHELWYGVTKSEFVERNSQAVALFLSRELEVLEFSQSDAHAAGEIRADLERRGKRIGEYDTLIAGAAFARNLTLVTANTREFNRVKGLRVEDWTL